MKARKHESCSDFIIIREMQFEMTRYHISTRFEKNEEADGSQLYRQRGGCGNRPVPTRA